MVANRHVEAHRLSREQMHHRKRLAEIQRSKAVTVSTWDRGIATDHRGTYGHLKPGRRTPLADADRALRMRQANNLQTERLERLQKKDPEHQRVAAQRAAAMEPALQRRVEQGRPDLQALHERRRRQAQAELERDNRAMQQRIKTAPARFASESTIRRLRGEEPKPMKARPARTLGVGRPLSAQPGAQPQPRDVAALQLRAY
jgi:hypothetical protein